MWRHCGRPTWGAGAAAAGGELTGEYKGVKEKVEAAPQVDVAHHVLRAGLRVALLDLSRGSEDMAETLHQARGRVGREHTTGL